jgi:hypothetical protein
MSAMARRWRCLTKGADMSTDGQGALGIPGVARKRTLVAIAVSLALASSAMASDSNPTATSGKGEIVAFNRALNPAMLGTRARVTVGPVHYATLGIVFILALHPDTVPHIQGHPFRQIRVMRDQHRVAIVQCQDKTLMAGAFVVIGQNTIHMCFKFDRDAGFLPGIGLNNAAFSHRCHDGKPGAKLAL